MKVLEITELELEAGATYNASSYPHNGLFMVKEPSQQPFLISHINGGVVYLCQGTDLPVKDIQETKGVDQEIFLKTVALMQGQKYTGL